MNLPVTLWTISLEQTQQAISESYQLLSPDEQIRADRYKVQRSKECFVLTRAALRRILANKQNCSPAKIAFDYNEQGKPRLRTSKQSKFTFSVSHSGGLAVVAIADCEHLGVDCEKMRPLSDPQSLARTVLSDAELLLWSALELAEQAHSLLTTWTLKEACLKAIGVGLAMPLRELDILGKQGGPLELRTKQELLALAAPWSLTSLNQIASYQIALAAAGISEEISPTFSMFDFAY